MSGHSKSLVCEEVFDERSQPSEEEVREFAVKIGIDPDEEPHLIPLAREGLLRPLPKNWKPVYDPHTKQYYYFNFKTQQSSWEHPLDNKFRDLVKKSRSESLSSAGEEDSKTSIKEELKSFEETAASIGLESDTSAYSKDNLMDSPSQKGRPLSAHSSRSMNPLVPTLKSALSPVWSDLKGEQDNSMFAKQRGKLAITKNDLKPVFTPKPLLFPLKKQTQSDWGKPSFRVDESKEGMKDLHDLRFGGDSKHLISLDSSTHDESVDSPSSSVIGRFTVDRVRKIDIDSQSKRLDSDCAESRYRSSNRFSKIGLGQAELTLSGGGSVFLKSNQKKKVEGKSDELAEGPSGSGNNSENVRTLGEMNSSLQSIESKSNMSPNRNLKSLPSWDTDSSLSAPHRSILRTPQGERRLWDVDPQHMSVSEKTLWKQQELEEEKKSVRFNLDKELNIMFKLSDSSASESSSEVEQGEEVGGTEENQEPSGSKGWMEQYQQLRSSRFKNADAEESPRAEKHLSPLEEWAKKTWFSEMSTVDDKESEDFGAAVKNTSDAKSILHEVDLTERMSDIEDQIEEIVHASNDTVKDQKVPDNLKSQDSDMTDSVFCADKKSTSQAESNQNPVLEENLKLAKLNEVSEKRTLMKQFSPVSQAQTSRETDLLLSSLNKKLESLISREAQEDSVSQEDRAREQAYRDWNVVHTGSEMHRPQLSRQQSQQQIQNMKQQIQEPARASDRDRALREWSVTKKSSESEIDSKSISVSLDNNQPEGNSFFLSSGSSLEGLQDSKQNFSNEQQMLTGSDTKDKSVNDSKTTGAISHFQMTENKRDISTKLELEEFEYEEHIKKIACDYKLRFEKDQEDIVKRYQEKLQKRLEEEAQKLELTFGEMMAKLEREADTRMKQLREQLEHKQECATQKLLEQHQKALAAQEVENQATMLHIREQHSADVKTLKEQLQREEEQIRREYHERMVSMREDRDGKRSKEVTDQLRIIEKLRCEKRIVEDKYRMVKEKYVKLKGEMKINIEKKVQKSKDIRRGDEKGRQEAVVAEQEITASQLHHESDRSSETESRPKAVSSGSSATGSALGFQQARHQQVNPSSDSPSPARNSGPSQVHKNNSSDENGTNLSFLGINFSNPVLQRHTPSSNNNDHVSLQASRHNSMHSRAAESNGNIPCNGPEVLIGSEKLTENVGDISPLEALRLQLRTLDELEEQFPASCTTDAYLRYPFSDAGNKELGSAELEFFHHRIHLERDMIRQAKNSLQAQQSEYRSRLHNFQQRQSSSASFPSTILYQMSKEEQELSDMEEKLHRTRRVLSEKMVHLHHLENSLYRLTAPTARSAAHVSSEFHVGKGNKVSERYLADKGQSKPQHHRDWKVGTGLWGIMDDGSDDISSDSGGSSGFSSTEYTSDGALGSLLSQSGSGRKVRKVQENSSDINLSLHNLNAEISEIWNVLCKQRAAAGLGPPPLLSDNTRAPAWVDTATNTNAPSPTFARTSSSLLSSSGLMTVPDKGKSLIERTTNLRSWLQKAKVTAAVPNTTGAKDRNELPF